MHKVLDQVQDDECPYCGHPIGYKIEECFKKRKKFIICPVCKEKCKIYSYLQRVIELHCIT